MLTRTDVSDLFNVPPVLVGAVGPAPAWFSLTDEPFTADSYKKLMDVHGLEPWQVDLRYAARQDLWRGVTS
jgi:hypothetical protein